MQLGQNKHFVRLYLQSNSLFTLSFERIVVSIHVLFCKSVCVFSLSGLTGYIGMHVSVRANVRTAEGARQGLAQGLSIAFRAAALQPFHVLRQEESPSLQCTHSAEF